jgi:hypothetical protein
MEGLIRTCGSYEITTFEMKENIGNLEGLMKTSGSFEMS